MEKIRTLMRKANKAYSDHTNHCGSILTAIEHMLPKDIDPMVFMQTDGLCVSDMDARNVPVSYILDWYAKNNRRMTYDDFLTLAI